MSKNEKSSKKLAESTDINESNHIADEYFKSKSYNSSSTNKALAIVRKDLNNSALSIVKHDRKKIPITHEFFTLSLLEFICNLLKPQNKEAAEAHFEGLYFLFFYLFRSPYDFFLNFIEICNVLLKYNFIRSNLSSFKLIRFQYQTMVHALFDHYQNLPPRLTYKET